MTPRPPAQLLDDALATDPGRPFLTWYDDSTGERLELSVATFANWVAKTAGLLVEGMGLEPGDTVRLLAPVDHWQAVVWAVATWRAACLLETTVDSTAARPVGAPRASVVVTGPDVTDVGDYDRGAADGRARVVAKPGLLTSPLGDVVALSLRPMGAPFAPGTLPPDAVDYAREVPTYADRFIGPLPPMSGAVAVDADCRRISGVKLAERADRLADAWGAGRGARLLVAPSAPPASHDERLDLVLATTLVPLSLDGSVVLVRAADPDALARRAEQEHVTVVTPWGNP